jgi:hypothetical protein
MAGIPLHGLPHRIADGQSHQTDSLLPSFPNPLPASLLGEGLIPNDGPPRKASSAYALFHRIPRATRRRRLWWRYTSNPGQVMSPCPTPPIASFPAINPFTELKPGHMHAGGQNPPACRSAANQGVPTVPEPVARLHAPLFTRLLLANFATMPLSATRSTMLRPVYRKSDDAFADALIGLAVRGARFSRT